MVACVGVVAVGVIDCRCACACACACVCASLGVSMSLQGGVCVLGVCMHESGC